MSTLVPQNNITVELYEDICECETCGTSYAEGAKVFLDDELVLVLEPIAHCYDGQSYTDEDIYRKILEHLGYTLIVE